jgi:hypothetical protein
MTVNDAISKVKDKKPNAYSEESLVDRLNDCEAMIQRELLLTEPDEIVQYDWTQDMDKELILPRPYDAVYVTYIIMMIQYDQEEYTAYNNSNAMFQTQYSAAQGYFNKLNPNPPSIKVTNWMRG